MYVVRVFDVGVVETWVADFDSEGDGLAGAVVVVVVVVVGVEFVGEALGEAAFAGVLELRGFW